ncbi:MAG: hypothetical protein ACI92E_001007, partial [Oceanicoccus sp.]
ELYPVILADLADSRPASIFQSRNEPEGRVS